ncbi:MAG: cytochrome c biogenesis protein CcsA, partial [Coriobacteriia bacterium]|nr:cytochrome c biogenesis protein CcsA [Coriobacteriia bacterium]
MTTEILIMWSAVTLYAVSAVLAVVGLVFRKPGIERVSVAVASAGLAVHAFGIGFRWVRVGHGPCLGFYEVVSSYAFVGVAAFLILLVRKRSLQPLAAAVMPLAFLTLGGAMLAPKSELAITGTLASWWLAIHVAFAKLAYGSFITAFCLAVLFLVRDWRRSEGDPLLGKVVPEALDDLSYKFVAAGFLFLGVMIAAGAIWANEAWGRYWGWDPIETWSLISWIAYALVLHARLTLGWRGRRFAWAA